MTLGTFQTKTPGRRAKATIIRATLGGKTMLVAEIDAKKYPYKKFKWGKWNFKISNLRYFENQLAAGSIVEGDLFDYLLYENGGEPTRFHVLKVVRY